MEPNTSSFPIKLNDGNVSSFGNRSQEKDYVSQPIELHLRLLVCVVKTVVCAAGAAGNLCVLQFLKKEEKIKTPKCATSNLNVFIRSLAISDVLVFLNIPFFWIGILSGSIYPGWLCKLRLFVAVVFCLITIYNLAVIGIERYILTCRPTSRPWSRATVLKALKGAWVLGFFLSLPHIYSINSVRVELNAIHYTIRCRHDNSQPISVAMFYGSVVVGYVIPFASICFTCISVVRMVWKRKFHASVAEKDVALALLKWRQKQMRATILLIVIMIAFLLPYLIYVIHGTVTIFNPQPLGFTSGYVIRNIRGLLAFLNSFINFCIHLQQLPGFCAFFKITVCHIKPNAMRQNHEQGIQMKRVIRQSPAPNNKGRCRNRRRYSEGIKRCNINCIVASGRRQSI